MDVRGKHAWCRHYVTGGGNQYLTLVNDMILIKGARAGVKRPIEEREQPCFELRRQLWRPM